MAHVKSKIKAADEAYKKALAQHKQTYKNDMVHAKQLWLQKQAIALEESVQSVISSLK
jgi:predicted SprT family Zn-dependent metalloprotease